MQELSRSVHGKDASFESRLWVSSKIQERARQGKRRRGQKHERGTADWGLELIRTRPAIWLGQGELRDTDLLHYRIQRVHAVLLRTRRSAIR
jgi:hypothetical protein